MKTQPYSGRIGAFQAILHFIVLAALALPSLGCRSLLRDHVMKFYQVKIEPSQSCRHPNAFQADFLYLKELGEEVVPCEDRYFPPDKRAAMESEILAKLGQHGCTKKDFVLNIQAYLSGFNCQHAYIADNPYPAANSGYYPFRVHYVSNELFLANIGTNQDSSLLGQKIIAINGLAIPEVEQKLFVSADAESLCTKRAELETSSAYTRPELYRFVGLVASTSNEITLEFAGHAPVQIAPTHEKNYAWQREPQPPHPITSRVSHQYDLRTYPKQNFGYLQFNGCFDRTAIIDGLNMVRPWVRPLVSAWLHWEFHRRKPAALLDGIYDPERPVLKDYLAAVVEELNSQGITNLIIDLRQNAGGECELTKQFIYYLTSRQNLRDVREFQSNPDVLAYYSPNDYEEFRSWYKNEFHDEPHGKRMVPTQSKPFFHEETNPKSAYFVAPNRPVFKGRIILLVNQNTGSAAAILAGLMHDNHLAQTVGTTTGNNPTGPTGMTPFKLPHTGIVISLPVEYDERAEPLNGELFQPDYWVENSIEDLFQRRDAAFEKALELIDVAAPTNGPLTKADIESAKSSLKRLKIAGQQPGWSKKDYGLAAFESYSYFAPRTVTIVTRKRHGSSLYHYTLVQRKDDADWELQTAWRTDRHDQIVQRYLIPDLRQE